MTISLAAALIVYILYHVGRPIVKRKKELNAECRMKNAELNAECRMQSKCRMMNAECRMRLNRSFGGGENGELKTEN